MDQLTDPLTHAAVLIIEDGDEYRESLTRFVPGPTWHQARSAAAALALLEATPIHLVYLDMRFDRIPRAELVGDHAAATAARDGDPARGWRYLQNNQGLFILDALARAGHADRPVILSHDFSREPARWRALSRRYPRLEWVHDAISPAEIRARMTRLLES
ncbi:MAG: hypothetical protein R3F65_20195 [bacterium]|nr:hypothetical protein [Myxococcales bacterium]MCB9551032.1 hypothetical protein [Myxococcales bacterium]